MFDSHKRNNMLRIIMLNKLDDEDALKIESLFTNEDFKIEISK